MINKLLREFYLLPRGEQRAMLLLSLLVILALGIRIAVQLLPAREPAGMEDFREEALGILAAREAMDSLGRTFAEHGSDTGYVDTRASKHASQHRKTKREVLPVNLNEADSAALLPLSGIGPVFAGRIVKYRKLLGGFVSTEQLVEVYGMECETVDRISPFLYVDTVHVQKLNLNTAGFRDLLRHPYLEYEDVKAILNYRDVEGRITSPGEIWEHGLLVDSVFERIVPYLEY